MQVNGAGNGMPEPRHGCHIGPVYQMPAMDAHCYSTVDAPSAIELEFTVGHCASVKEVAQTMIWKPDQYYKDSIYIAESYSFFNQCIFDSVNIKVHVLVKIILDGQNIVTPKIICNLV